MSRDRLESAERRGDARSPVALLFSGGLDSAILLSELARRRSRVFLLYVRSGLVWEEPELAAARKFVQSLNCDDVSNIVVLDAPVRDVYDGHWSVTGDGVPGADTADAAVYLPGRNLLLLTKAAVWCRQAGVNRLAMAPLANNPFPDATDAFFLEFQSALNRGLDADLAIERPFAGLGKKEVMLLGRELRLEFTFSCVKPVQGRHCGVCNKCGERRRAFVQAEIHDPTGYADALR